MGLRAASLDPLIAQRRLLLQNVESQRRVEQLPLSLQLSVAANELRIAGPERERVTALVQTAATASRAVNLAAVGEEAVREIRSQISEIRGLAVRAGEEALLANIGLQSFQQRIARILLRLQFIAETTRFAGVDLFDGNFNDQFLIGRETAISLEVPNLSPDQLGRGVIDAIPNLAQLNLAIDPEALDEALLVIDAAADEVGLVDTALRVFEADVLESAIGVVEAEREQLGVRFPPFQISLALPGEAILSEILDQANILARAVTNGFPGAILDLLA